MTSTGPWTSDLRIVRAPRHTDDVGAALRSVFTEASRLPDTWVRLLARLDGDAGRRSR